MSKTKKSITIIMIIVIMAAFALSAGAEGEGMYGVKVTGYENSKDYMAEMRKCAEDGSEYAMQIGAIYEQQRNLKIRNTNAGYEQTEFFSSGLTAGEVMMQIRIYTGELESIGRYSVTGYDPYCAHCCGKSDGITASGVPAVTGTTIAMYGYPFGTQVYIVGLGYFTVHDRGVGPGSIDLALDGHAACYAVTGKYDTYVVNMHAA